jgi:putative transposase
MNTQGKQTRQEVIEAYMPTMEELQREMAEVESLDDFFGKEGILGRLFGQMLETMMQAELTEQLGYEPYEAKGRNSGNSRNGTRPRTVKSSAGEIEVKIPRDRKSEYQPIILERYGRNTNELEEKILGLYAKGMTTRDIEEIVSEAYGVAVSPATVSKITDKIWDEVEAWQNRPLATIYPIMWLDASHIKLRREGRVENVAVYVALAVDLTGHKAALGHWVGDGAEGANFWMSVLNDLQARGVQDIFIACVDGLSGFKDAIQAVFPKTLIQRCLVHQIRNSLKYVTWADRKEFTQDLKTIYRAPTREQAETQLLKLAEKWGAKYPIAVRSWEDNWEDLALMFDYPAEIRRLIYTTNPIESYNWQLRKVTKNKAAFPAPAAVRKLLYLADLRITTKWTQPIRNWAAILNQLAIRFEGRMPV